MRTELLQAARIALVTLIVASTVFAQQPEKQGKIDSPDVPQQDRKSSNISTAAPPSAQATHRFWDRTNDWWFAGVGAARAFDYESTLNLRRRGLNEIFLTNSIVDNHALFAGIEAAATAASIGASYLFHRTGHHRLERWTSIVHFGLTVSGGARNYALKNPH